MSTSIIKFVFLLLIVIISVMGVSSNNQIQSKDAINGMKKQIGGRAIRCIKGKCFDIRRSSF
ncbi:hypothetical protein PRIPAC_76881 [Pristionchus pacificus]|uniref:Uncharacterized protein n=1 Tax=Pristionchus pacificus TaxID=54126 RepID=A0A2A6CB72_PRIPA|nr:hypothetical protein PRIPAC_76881 [Pristionchus pacificus]|eukprot:PDM75472.1 hypothetical protein PRIPAC_42649 [Pristionchus pacificus]